MTETLLEDCRSAWQNMSDAECEQAWQSQAGDLYRQCTHSLLPEVYSMGQQARHQLNALWRQILAEPQRLNHRLLLSLYRRKLDQPQPPAPAWLEAAQDRVENQAHLRLLMPPPSFKVSICLTTYNRPGMLKRALESVRNQTYPDWELHLNNHGSTDETDSYCRSQLADTRIHYTQLKQNTGLSGILSIWDRFCEQSNHELIVNLADDDWLKPDFLENCITFFKSHSWISLCGGGFCSVDLEERLIKQCGPFYAQDTIADPRRELQRSAINCAVGVGLVLRKSLLKALAAHDPVIAGTPHRHAVWEYYYFNQLVAETEVGLIRETTGMHTIASSETTAKISTDRDNSDFFLHIARLLNHQYARLFGADTYPRDLMTFFFNRRVLMENMQTPIQGLFQLSDPAEFEQFYTQKLKDWQTYTRLRYELIHAHSSTQEPVFYTEANAFGPVAATP